MQHAKQDNIYTNKLLNRYCTNATATKYSFEKCLGSVNLRAAQQTCSVAYPVYRNYLICNKLH